jgi:transposase
MKCLPLGLSPEKVEIWFQDEARIGQRGTVCRIWAEKGSRPRVVRQQQFKATYIFGAVCPEADKGCAIIYPDANHKGMNHHLREVSRSVAKGKHALVICDQAGWHKSGDLERFENLSLMMLPPYSPELNPTEQVWQILRRRELSNRNFKSEADIVEAISHAWKNFIGEAESIKKLCTRSWAKLSAF